MNLSEEGMVQFLLGLTVNRPGVPHSVCCGDLGMAPQRTRPERVPEHIPEDAMKDCGFHCLRHETYTMALDIKQHQTDDIALEGIDEFDSHAFESSALDIYAFG